MGELVVTTWASLGPVVRDARQRAGYTQTALAEAAGVSRGWLIRFEAGLRNAEPATVFRVLALLDLDLVLRPHVVTDDEEMLREILGEQRPEIRRGRRGRDGAESGGETGRDSGVEGS